MADLKPSIISNLHLFITSLSSSKDNTSKFKIKAYQKAITILNNYPHPITNIDDLKNINGIGERILSKIKEFINII